MYSQWCTVHRAQDNLCHGHVYGTEYEHKCTHLHPFPTPFTVGWGTIPQPPVRGTEAAPVEFTGSQWTLPQLPAKCAGGASVELRLQSAQVGLKWSRACTVRKQSGKPSPAVCELHRYSSGVWSRMTSHMPWGMERRQYYSVYFQISWWYWKLNIFKLITILEKV